LSIPETTSARTAIKLRQAAASAAGKIPGMLRHTQLFVQLPVIVVAYAIVVARDNNAKRLTRLYERATI
jgi:hypothetical protein